MARCILWSSRSTSHRINYPPRRQRVCFEDTIWRVRCPHQSLRPGGSCSCGHTSNKPETLRAQPPRIPAGSAAGLATTALAGRTPRRLAPCKRRGDPPAAPRENGRDGHHDLSGRLSQQRPSRRKRQHPADPAGRRRRDHVPRQRLGLPRRRAPKSAWARRSRRATAATRSSS